MEIQPIDGVWDKKPQTSLHKNKVNKIQEIKFEKSAMT